MASKSLGTLTLDLIAKVGGFTAGMTEAERAADKSAKKIQSSVKSIGVAGYAVGTALGGFLKDGISAAVAAFPELLNQVAQFQDLAEETGASAAGLAGFAVAAATAGVSMESVASASIKLTKSLVGVDDESKAAGAALKSLGLNIADFKKLDPVAQYEAVSKALAGYADGAGKTAVAVALFGKSGAEQLKVMKALEEQGGRTNILTAEQIALADDFLDRQAKLRAEFGLYAGAIATQFLEPTNILIKLLKDAAAELVNTSGAVTQLGVNAGVQTFAENAGRALANVIDFIKTTKTEFGVLTDFIGSSVEAVQKYGSFDFAGGRKVGEDFRKRYGLDELGRKTIADNAKDSAKSFVQKYDEELARSRSDRNRAALNAVNYGTGKDGRPTLRPPVTKPGGGADDPTKKLLENDLKAFKAQGDQAKELLADRNKILDLYNSQGLISVRAYYDALRTNAEESTDAQKTALDAQTKALEDYKSRAPKATDRADAQGKINELLIQQSKLERDSGNAAIEMGIKQQQAARAYQDSLNEVNAKILELDGNLGKAAEIRFDAQNRSLRALAEASGDFASVAQIDRLREYTKAQADLNALQSKFSLAQGDLSIAEERITQARERGTMGEIESLKASGKAREEAVAVMQKQLEAYQALDAAALSPEQAQAIERLKVQLEGLKSTIDPLADKFNTMFSDAAGSAFSDFIDGTKSASEAFKSFTDSIFKELTNLIVKDLFKKLFSGSGDSGGFNIGSLLSSAFSGSSGGIPGFVGGGFTGMGAANDPAGIVHKGEYVLNAKQTAAIGVANLDRGNFGGGMVVNINQAFAAGTNAKTTQQAALQASRELQRSQRNA